jgi:hypothetical protein
MALDIKGKTIHCDGEACEAETLLPIALRSTLDTGAGQRQAAWGWLFVVKGDCRLHFCPLCSRRIRRIGDNAVKE